MLIRELEQHLRLYKHYQRGKNSTVESGSQTQMYNKLSMGSDFVRMQKA